MSIESPSLAAKLENNNGPLPWREVARLGARVARLLDRRHVREGAHGGIEPLTVLFVGGAVRLADPLPPSRRNPAFVAPAVLAGAPADRQADFFSLGRLIEAMVAGPQGDAGAASAADAQGLPAPLSGVVARLLAGDVLDGYRSGNEVAAALELAMAASEAYAETPPQPAAPLPPPAEAAPPPAPPVVAPSRTRRPARSPAGHQRLLVGLAVLLLAGGAATLLLWPSPEESDSHLLPVPATDDNGGVSRSMDEADRRTGRQIDPTSLLPPLAVSRAADEARLAELLAAMHQRSCTRLEVESGPAGTRLWGSVATADDRLRLIDALAAADLTNHLVDHSGVGLAAGTAHCRLFDLLAMHSELAVPRLASLYPERASYRLTETETLVVKVLTPGFPSYLTVDYFAADAMVVHLETSVDDTAPLPPYELVKIGDPRDGHRLVIAPPFGDEVVLAIASSVPLFEEPRPMIEPAEAYLDALAAALEALPTTPLASTIVIRTRAKGQRHPGP